MKPTCPRNELRYIETSLENEENDKIWNSERFQIQQELISSQHKGKTSYSSTVEGEIFDILKIYLWTRYFFKIIQSSTT